MKNFIFTLLFLMYFYPIPAKSQNHNVTSDEAIIAVKKIYESKDFNFYIVEDNDSLNWTIFVDAEPLKNWAHKCYTYKVPKRIDSIEELVPTNLEELRFPPNYNLTPKDIKVKCNEDSSYQKIINRLNNLTPIYNKAAKNTYAIILSGGLYKYGNCERYWNDCSFIYTTLRKYYQIPKNNIIPLMSDGNNPEEDLWVIDTGNYISQNLDLDNDGSDDIKLAATRENVFNTFELLTQKLKKGDQLFIFVIDHGDYTSDFEHSYICLWTGDLFKKEELYDYELADLIRPLTKNGVLVNAVLGQCYSGGFIDDLNMEGCVVATACSYNEPSGFYNNRYDEFVYQWTQAIIKQDPSLDKYMKDTNGNGSLSAEESFNFAKLHSRLANQEHPKYGSNPEALGKLLAFDFIPKDLELYLKDSNKDLSNEPNPSRIWWDSPSIKANTNSSNTDNHQSFFSTETESLYINVWIHNAGIKDFVGKDYSCKLNWALSSTILNEKVFEGEELSISKIPTGGKVGIKNIPPIKAGDSVSVNFKWIVPTELKDAIALSLNKKNQIPNNVSFYSEIIENNKENIKSNLNFDVQKYNKIAVKNAISFSYLNDIATKNTTRYFYIYNPSENEKTYSLELVPSSNDDTNVYNKANIEVFTCIDNLQSKSIKFSAEHPFYSGISLKPNQYGIVGVKVSFFESVKNDTKYNLNFIQKDDNGTEYGGISVLINNPLASDIELPKVLVNYLSDGNSELSIDNSELSSIIWLNSNLEVLSDSTCLIITPQKENNIYKLAAITSDGKLAKSEILINKNIGINNINYDKNEQTLTVEMYSNDTKSNYLLISSILTGKAEKNIKIESTTQKIPLSDLEDGMYLISYISPQGVVNTFKFTK